AILPLRHCTEGCRKEQSRKGCLHEITRNEGEESHCEHRLVKPDDKAQPKKARRVDSSSGHEGSGDRRPDGATGTSTEKRTCDKGLESKAYEEAAGGTRDIGKADALLGCAGEDGQTGGALRKIEEHRERGANRPEEKTETNDNEGLHRQRNGEKRNGNLSRNRQQERSDDKGGNLTCRRAAACAHDVFIECHSAFHLGDSSGITLVINAGSKNSSYEKVQMRNIQ